MAEGTLIGLTSKLLCTIESPSFKRSLHFGSEQLERLRRRFLSIEAVLGDGEKLKERSNAVRSVIQRLSDVLYDAEDLFDELSTKDLLSKQQSKGKKVVRPFFSKSNQLVFSYIYAKKVKAIMMSLDEISKEVANFRFVHRVKEPISDIRKGVASGWYTDQNLVVGRENDKSFILGSLLGGANAKEDVSIIAVVGIGGMGKTTLVQLVYNDPTVQKSFEARCWTCVSDVYEEVEIIRSIFEPIVGKSCHGLDLSQLDIHLGEFKSMKDKFLLVIDDMRVDDCSIGKKFRNLLTRVVTRGSKIIVTTRSLSVAAAISADITYELNGLSSDDSWELFKRIAFTREQENDPRWNKLGKSIVQKCANVPLAIKSIASLLYTKPSKEEWQSILDSQLVDGDASIRDTLKLSYDHLPTNLKRSFSYCSLIPKDYVFRKEELIYLWIAQGYIIPKYVDAYEEVGDAYFRELFQRCFFQTAKEGENSEVFPYEMHDLMHDLARSVAEPESILLTEGLSHSYEASRHFSVGYKIDSSWEIPPSLLKATRLRSSLFMRGGFLSPLVLGQLLTRFKFLRAMDLRHQNIEEVPDSIGRLIHLRYLNLSGNKFKILPISFTKLFNLLTLDISSCVQLEVWPDSFRKLINLRHLNTAECEGLRYMPPGFGELTSLQHLSYFKVGKVTGGVKSSRLDALRGLKLRGKLQIMFDDGMDYRDEDELWQLPTTIEEVEICSYPGRRMPPWDQWKVDSLVRLNLYKSSIITHLPPLRCLPNLKALHLSRLDQLEYVEEKQDENESRLLFFPSLEDLQLSELPKLMGWSRWEAQAVTTSQDITEEEDSSCIDPPDQMPSFPLLSTLKVEKCPMLKSLPQFPRLQTLELEMVREEVIQHLLSASCHSLETIAIRQCASLSSFPGETLTSVRLLELTSCNEVKSLHLPLPPHNVLEKLVIQCCPQLKLWEDKEGGVDWDSFINLRVLLLDGIPDAERLPSRLQHLQSLGKLEIRESS